VIERTAVTADPHPESVRRSLRALADGSAPSARSSTARPIDDRDRVDATVRDAEAATSCARAAATFLRNGQLPELDAAVRAAERHGWTGLSQNGRRTLATLRRLDAALRGDASGAESDVARDATTSAPVAERF